MEIPQICLASGSIYKRGLIEKLGLPLISHSPDIDERRHADESPTDFVQRLSLEKAQALREIYPHAWIIGSDQGAFLGDKLLQKPGNFTRASQQLRQMSGKAVDFYTGLALLLPHQPPLVGYDHTQVKLRQLTDQQIENYLAQDQPFDTAGSFKSEGLGIVLFESLTTQDPNALVGLPLILLTSFLAQRGLQLPLKNPPLG